MLRHNWRLTSFHGERADRAFPLPFPLLDCMRQIKGRDGDLMFMAARAYSHPEGYRKASALLFVMELGPCSPSSTPQPPDPGVSVLGCSVHLRRQSLHPLYLRR